MNNNSYGLNPQFYRTGDFQNRERPNSYGLNPQLYGTGNPPQPDSSNDASGSRQESNQPQPKPNYVSTDAFDNPISRKLDSMFSGDRQDEQQQQPQTNNQGRKNNMANPYVFTPLGQQVSYNQGVANTPLNTQPVGQLLNNGQYVIDPSQQLALQQQYANQAANDELARQQAGLAYGTGIGNQVRNADTQRLMAVNAQAQAAANVANQLNNLAAIRSNGANTIANVLSSALNAR